MHEQHEATWRPGAGAPAVGREIRRRAMAAIQEADRRRAEREMWATGDYARIALDMFWEVGAHVVRRVAVRPGERVLDVACGTGNAAIRAAQAGGRVTGVDLTPELFEAGRRQAAEAGVEIDWVEGDAEALPFADGAFDVVLSTFGCMFAPRHEVAARELARVLAQGGRLGICSWTPQSSIAELMRAMFAHLPPEGLTQPPPLWGVEEHVRALFDGTGVALAFEHGAAGFRAGSVEEALRLYETEWGPFVQAREALEPQGGWDALRADLAAVLEGRNTAADGTLAYDGEYLLVTGAAASAT